MPVKSVPGRPRLRYATATQSTDVKRQPDSGVLLSVGSTVWNSLSPAVNVNVNRDF